jgi:hypothetical protein
MEHSYAELHFFRSSGRETDGVVAMDWIGSMMMVMMRMMQLHRQLSSGFFLLVTRGAKSTGWPYSCPAFPMLSKTQCGTAQFQLACYAISSADCACMRLLRA